MEIIDYLDIYENDVKELLLELQEHISDIDIDGYNIVTDEYKNKYFNKTIKEVNKYEGKILLAKENDEIVGLVVGLINNEEIDTYDFKAPKRGRITELIVSKKYRSKGLGKILLNKMENHLNSVGCKCILLDVFAFNNRAISFYENNGYYSRTMEMMKKL